MDSNVKAGILIDTISFQKGYFLIKNLNKLCLDTPKLDIIVFRTNYSILPTAPHFAIMQEKEAWDFDGKIIAADFISAKKLINCPGPIKKYFYIYDLEWLNMVDFNYTDMVNIYQNDRLDLIARSESHAKIISNNWKNPVQIMADWQYNVLKELLL